MLNKGEKTEYINSLVSSQSGTHIPQHVTIGLQIYSLNLQSKTQYLGMTRFCRFHKDYWFSFGVILHKLSYSQSPSDLTYSGSWSLESESSSVF